MSAAATKKSGGVKGPILKPHQVVIRPMVTEKATFHIEENNAYTFLVHANATKPQIKEAIERLFEVKVEAVRVQNRPGKKRRYRQHMGKVSGYRKAIVTLNEEYRITLF